MKHPEHDLQRAVAQYLSAVLDKSVEWSSIDHAGKSKVRQAMLKARGVKPGWPDITLYWPPDPPNVVRGQYNVFPQNDTKITACISVGHIELKSAAGRLSPEQIAFANRVQELGHHWKLARSVDDVRDALKEWGVPTREAGADREFAGAMDRYDARGKRGQTLMPLYPSAKK